jgi:hypothetical protein
MARYNPAIFVETKNLLKAFNLAVSESSEEVRLTIYNDCRCVIQTYSSVNELVGESEFKALFNQMIFKKDGLVYSYPITLFKPLLSRFEDCQFLFFFFDEEEGKTEILAEGSKGVLKYLKRVR